MRARRGRRVREWWVVDTPPAQIPSTRYGLQETAMSCRFQVTRQDSVVTGAAAGRSYALSGLSNTGGRHRGLKPPAIFLRPSGATGLSPLVIDSADHATA